QQAFKLAQLHVAEREQMGTTMFRPNYTPVTFGAVAGRHCGHIFEPVRYTALQAWHVKNGAEFEDVGQWKRPWYFPRNGEDVLLCAFSDI
ncbi:hypothetical protein, partial [Klebsiella variicola]|uniref:hypothetical protein n=1 Tax=Klebsiella variicola TaxID=244366 RepID=UPI00272FC7DE